MNILITSVGGTLIPLLTKFLKQDDQLFGLYIVGIDKNNKIKKNKYLDKFYSIKSNNDVQLIFPSSSIGVTKATIDPFILNTTCMKNRLFWFLYLIELNLL